MNGFEQQRFRERIDRLTEGHNQLVKLVNERKLQQVKTQQRQQIEAMKEIVTHSYSRSASYNNLIMVGGYAVFFTVWKSMKADLNNILVFGSGLLVLTSALLFVIAAVHRMLSMELHFRKLVKKLQQESSPTLMEDIQSAERESEVRMFKVWRAIFIPTLVLGVLGGLLLLGGFAHGLIVEFVT